MKYYLVHGLVVSSQVELPIIETARRHADVAYRVARRSQGTDGGTAASRDDDDWAIERWLNGRLIVDFPGPTRFALTHTDITLLTDGAADVDRTAHLFLDHVMPRVVALRSDLMLHASGAVGPSGRAHLFLGESGRGKSTIATVLATGGWPLLDDDGVRVVERDGSPMAVPGYAGVRLWPDTAAALLPGSPAGRPMGQGVTKRWMAVDGMTMTMAPGPVPIHRVYVLERTLANHPSVASVGFTDALTAVVHYGFFVAEDQVPPTRPAFERAAAFASKVTVVRLFSREGLEHLASTTALVAEFDRLSG